MLTMLGAPLAVSKVVLEVQGNKSTSEILKYLSTIPDQLQSTYMYQSNCASSSRCRSTIEEWH